MTPTQHQPFPALDVVQRFVWLNLKSNCGCPHNLGIPKVANRKGALGHLIHWNKGKCLLTTAHKTLDLQANALSKNHVACMLCNGGGCKLLVDQHGLVTDQQTIKGNMPTLGQCPSGIPLYPPDRHSPLWPEMSFAVFLLTSYCQAVT